MAKYRQRFNDAARAGGVAKRNALKAKRQKQFNRELSAEEIEAAQKKHEAARPESDARKRVRMAMQFPEKANAAKRKRLEKYIDKQVRKEEKDDLLQKLAMSQKQVQAGTLQTLGSLGAGSHAAKNFDSESDASASENESEPENAEATLASQRPKPTLPSDSELDSDLDSQSDSGSGAQQGSELSSDAEEDLVISKQKTLTKPIGVDTGRCESEGESPKGDFVDHRPGGSDLGLAGFGFANLPEKRLSKPKKKMSWQQRLGISAAQELLRKVGTDQDAQDDDSNDSEDSEDSGDSDGSGDSENSDDSEMSKINEEDSVQTSDRGSAGEASEHENDGSDSEESSDDEEYDSESYSDASEGVETKQSSGREFSAWAKSMDPEASTPSVPTPRPENYVHVPRKTEGQESAEADQAQQSRPGWVERLALDPVVVERSPEIDSSRAELPAVASEQQIMDSVNHFDVVVVTGATGSGKTTQIPQFLFESGYGSKGMIGVTQPRRVAAVSMAKRIGSELCGAAEVGYQIRFDSKVSANTQIKLMTDGVLLKEMSSDLLLSRYSVIVVDEAHERSVNTDILIGLISRVVKLRRERGSPLKLVIMSATLRVADFAENDRLFQAPPPVVSVESRQHPVSVHFSRRTATDYVEEAVSKAKKIHERLPPGGILIFLTGKDEISRAMAELDPNSKEVNTVVSTASTSVIEEENVDFGVDNLDIDSEAGDGIDDDSEESDLGEDMEPDANEPHDQKKLHVLPLYSLLSTEDQLKVFEPVPAGHRLCVVATNVAETSLTIPGIRYVIDCGRSKQRIYDMSTGIQKYAVRWVSKASADQRAGRAGRTGPGHCYRLFSSAVYESAFVDFGEPEISRMPVEGLVLQMKAMGIHQITNFPFPTPVPQSSLNSGLRLLETLGAVDSEGKLTPLGSQMSLFPLHPRHAKMLLIGNQHGSLPFVVALVAALSVDDLIVDITKVPVLDEQADVLQLLSAVAAYSWTPTKDMCATIGVRSKAMSEIASLRGQLAHLVARTLRSDAVSTLTKQLAAPLPVPSKVQLSVVKQIVAAGYIDMVAARQALFDTEVRTSRQVSRVPYITVQRGPVVFLHPTTKMQKAPDFVVYHSLTSREDTDKIRIRPLTAVTDVQLANLAVHTPMLTYSKPMGGAYAPKMLGPNKREVWVVPRYGAAAGSGGLGWDLPAKKITQVRQGGKWISQ